MLRRCRLRAAISHDRSGSSLGDRISRRACAISHLPTLKIRAEFLAVRGGVRASVPSCLIEARQRRISTPVAPVYSGARFGFTVTKKLGNAVIRNRIRRRLKAAIGELAPAAAKDGYDYVVVARHAALHRAYSEILADLTRAFAILNNEAPSKPPKNRTKQPKNPQA